MEGEEEGAMGKQSSTSTDPFPLRLRDIPERCSGPAFEKTDRCTLNSRALLQLSLRAPPSGVLSPGRHCSNERRRSQWRAKKYFSSKVSHVSNSLLNNYYAPGISTQINEMLRSPGLPGAHGFIRETGHVLKS